MAESAQPSSLVTIWISSLSPCCVVKTLRISSRLDCSCPNSNLHNLEAAGSALYFRASHQPSATRVHRSLLEHDDLRMPIEKHLKFSARHNYPNMVAAVGRTVSLKVACAPPPRASPGVCRQCQSCVPSSLPPFSFAFVSLAFVGALCRQVAEHSPRGTSSFP